MKKYGYVKLTDDGERIFVSWNETPLDRVIDDLTNTVGYKPVRDLVTGIVIAPDPFVYWDGETINVKQSKKATYVYGPIGMSRKSVYRELEELRENLVDLEKYVRSIYTKKAANNLDRVIGGRTR